MIDFSKYPETLSELSEELALHSRDGRSDALFRFVIAASQFGSLAAHLSHDQVLNPTARPYGSPESEKSDAGHALVQQMTYCILRNINIPEAINIALDNLREKDFIRKQSSSPKNSLGGLSYISGIPAYPGITEGISFVDPTGRRLQGTIPPNRILVISHPTADISRYIGKFLAIVTDHGGTACHTAIIAKEQNIPCIVGTGNATELIPNNQMLKIENEKVIFEKVVF